MHFTCSLQIHDMTQDTKRHNESFLVSYPIPEKKEAWMAPGQLEDNLLHAPL